MDHQGREGRYGITQLEQEFNYWSWCYLDAGGEFLPTALTTTHCVYCLHLILLICAQTYQLSCEIIISDFKGKNPIILYNLGIALGLRCPCAMALTRNRYSWVEVVAVLITLLYLNKCRVILFEVVNGDVGDSGDYGSQFQATLCVASRGVHLAENDCRALSPCHLVSIWGGILLAGIWK